MVRDIYIPYVYKKAEQFEEITFDQIMNGLVDIYDNTIAIDAVDKRYIRVLKRKSDTLITSGKSPFSVEQAIKRLYEFNKKYESLEKSDKKTLYFHFEIPKRGDAHKMRPIDAPCDELKIAHEELLNLLKAIVPVNHHSAAYAYINGRSTFDAVHKHKEFGFNWFAHFDFHGFFPNTNIDFIMNMLSVVWPMSEIYDGEATIVKEEFVPDETGNTYMKIQNEITAIGKVELRKAIELCMLNGGLPQGTVISPWLTNFIMIPFDYEFGNAISNFKSKKNPNGDRFCYTRYADDIHVSCRVPFDVKEVESLIESKLKMLGASFSLNKSKTAYKSRRYGNVYMLGVCLNSSGDVTIGHEREHQLKVDLWRYMQDKAAGRAWDTKKLQQFYGTINYYRQVNQACINNLMRWFRQHYNTDVESMLLNDLSKK